MLPSPGSADLNLGSSRRRDHPHHKINNFTKLARILIDRGREGIRWPSLCKRKKQPLRHFNPHITSCRQFPWGFGPGGVHDESDLLTSLFYKLVKCRSHYWTVKLIEILRTLVHPCEWAALSCTNKN